MAGNERVLELQQRHGAVRVDEFRSVPDYCVYLMHKKAYLEAAARFAGQAVLDCGCNVGYGTAIMAGSAESVVGIDLNEAAIQRAKATYPELDFKLTDGSSIPFDDASFEAVVSFQVIEHVGDYESYLSEIRRVLRPGGIALFTTPNRAIRLEPGMKPWNEFHVTEFTADQLSSLLAQYFKDVTVHGMFGVPGNDAVYRVEFERCQRHLAANKKLFGFRPLLRRVLPSRLRSAMRKSAKGDPLTPAELGAYSVDQVEYRVDPDAIASSIDLMAVCRT